MAGAVRPRPKFIIERQFCLFGRHYLRPFPVSAASRFDLFCAYFLFVQALQVIGVFGAHPSVPKGKIQPVINQEFAVMLVMMGRPDNPFSEPGPCLSRRVYLRIWIMF